MDEDIAQTWRKTILASPTLKIVLDMIQVQKTVAIDVLPAKIASTLGAPDSAMTRTGTNTLIEILKKSGLLVESDGKYSILAEAPGPETRVVQENISSPPPPDPSGGSTEAKTRSTHELPLSTLSAHFPIHVNIELHLPASSEQSVYDAIFKSIRENLIP